MRIGPIRDAMAAQRVRESQHNFQEAADYVRDHDAPRACDPVLWAMHGAACREMAAEMEAALAKWARKAAQ